MFRLFKICFTTIMLIGFFSINRSYSQDKMGWGFNIGAAYDSFRGNDYSDLLEFKIGYLAGIGNRMNIAPSLNLNIDLNYELKAYKLETSLQLGSQEIISEYLNKYHFINLPVVFDVPFDGEKLWFFELGGYVNFLLGESLEIETVIPRFKKLDYGMLLGIGKVFEFNNNMDLIVGLRYELGLVNTAMNEGSAPAGIDVRTSSIKLMFTWVFAK
ncbi:MAG: outer membrane beta-barrel protein [Allomuricauda sp.]